MRQNPEAVHQTRTAGNRLASNLSGSRDVLPRSCRGVAGAQQRHNGHKREHSQTENELLERAGFLFACLRVPVLSRRDYRFSRVARPSRDATEQLHINLFDLCAD